MTTDKAAEQVESTKLTATKMVDPSAGQVDERKPHSAGDNATSNSKTHSVDQAALHELRGERGGTTVAANGASCTEQSDACHNLFNTVELLETILSKLPIKDLLFAQSVCKTWKNCVDHSKVLQQGLFFAPPELKPIEMIYDAGNEDNLQRALYAKADASDPAEVEFLRACLTRCANPLLVCAFGSGTLATYLLDPSKSPRVEERFTRPEASWKRMTALYPALDFPDISLPIEQKLKSFAMSREEAIDRAGGPLMIAAWEESLRRLAHAGTDFVCEAAQKYETAEELASAVDELKQGEKL